jgi:hypothetical protein
MPGDGTLPSLACTRHKVPRRRLQRRFAKPMIFQNQSQDASPTGVQE